MVYPHSGPHMFWAVGIMISLPGQGGDHTSVGQSHIMGWGNDDLNHDILACADGTKHAEVSAQ